jgi:molybdate transport system regulatory protein
MPDFASPGLCDKRSPTAVVFVFCMMKKKEIRFRCWIEIDGVKFFGPGPAELLEHIEQEGSIAKAAKQMGMSYKKAWDLVDDLNARGRSPYVESHKGGEKGGGASLTKAGKTVVTHYRRLAAKLNKIVEKEVAILKHI